MVAAIPFAGCFCAVVSRSSSSTLASAASPSSTSIGGWIEENCGGSDIAKFRGRNAFQVRASGGRRRLLHSKPAANRGSRLGCGVSLTTSSITCDAVEISLPCCASVDNVEFGETRRWEQNGEARVDMNSWSWPQLDGMKGRVLGLAMACLLVAGEAAAPGDSLAAMRVVRSPRTEYDPVSEEEREASSAFARRVTEALELLDQARKAQARDDFSEALRCYSLVTKNSGDLALAEYSRVGRALTLYEVGDRSEAIAELEDMSLSLKGYPEVHAALAAALYTDKHAPVPAEQQFTFATLLDPRYTDPSWVRSAKHWPPSLIVSLQRFIALK